LERRFGTKKVAPWGKSLVDRVIAHNPKMSFLGFYQPILGFGVSQRISDLRNPNKRREGGRRPEVTIRKAALFDSPLAAKGRTITSAWFTNTKLDASPALRN